MTASQTLSLQLNTTFIVENFNVLGIIASGSIVRGNGNDQSDLEILNICKFLSFIKK